MRVNRRNILRRLFAFIAGIIGVGTVSASAQIEKEAISSEKGMDWIQPILDVGGRLIIKIQNGRLMLAFEVEIDNQTYHIGVYLDSPNEIIERGEDFTKSFLAAFRRRKISLEITGKKK